MTTTTRTPLIIAVSAIDEAAWLAIERAGGRVGRASTGEGKDELATLLVRLPAEAQIPYRGGTHDIENVYIALPTQPPVTLKWTRSWRIEECSLDLHRR